MISSLNGLIQRNGAGFVVLDVGGVGYHVWVPASVNQQAHIGDALLLHTALIVREDAFVLFGFDSLEGLELFELLRSVTGVGPKSAMACISQLSVEAIRDAVLRENDATFKAVSGIGPKTAKLITVTLAGKLAGFATSKPTQDAKPSKPTVDLTVVVQALQGLGWPERQAAEAVRQTAESLGDTATADNLLRASLALLGTGRSVSGGDA